MIQIRCDACDKPIDVPDDKAGMKIDCPYCGDVNRVPEAEPSASEPVRESERSAQSSNVERINGELALLGFPPFGSSEETAKVFRPSWARTHPFATAFLAVVPIAITIVGLIYDWKPLANHWGWVAPLLGWLILGAMIGWTRLTTRFRVTGRGIELVEGFLSRSERGVDYTDIRTTDVQQSFLNRIFRVGTLEISTADSDKVEIAVPSLPTPRKVEKAIDLYKHSFRISRR